MKILSAILLLFLSFQKTFSQSMPNISGETVNQKRINIPADLMGKYSLLCFASSMKAQKDFESWLDPLYQKFIAKTGLMDDLYDVNLLFIPVLTGTNVSFAATMKKKFRENAQEDLHPHVLFCESEGKDLLTTLGIGNTEMPHFFLLDQHAKIIYRTEGKFTEEKFDAIDDLIE